MVVRPAGANDIEPWGRLWEASARAAFAPLLPEGHPLPEPAPERLREGLADPAVSLLVADDGGALGGFVGCGSSRDPDAAAEVGEVRSLFVGAGRWRGGVGRALIDAALADLGGRGYSFATVWSFADNERANRFYEASGFERDGGERREAVWADLLEVRYRRPLP